MLKSVSVLIVAAVLLAGCSKEFKKIPWSAEELSTIQMLVEQNDHDSRVELGRLNFLHNNIDDADVLLTQAVSDDPQDMEAKAWLAANDCKIAGRLGPWLMGLDKLYDIRACLSDLKDAAAAAPDNFTVSIIQINIDAEIDMFGSMERAVISRDRILQRMNVRPNAYPPSAKAVFFDASARVEELRGNIPLAQGYLQKIIDLHADENSVKQAKEKMQQLATLTSR